MQRESAESGSQLRGEKLFLRTWGKNYKDVHTLTQKRGCLWTRSRSESSSLRSWIKVCLMTKAQQAGLLLNGTWLSLFGPLNVKQALPCPHSVTWSTSWSRRRKMFLFLSCFFRKNVNLCYVFPPPHGSAPARSASEAECQEPPVCTQSPFCTRAKRWQAGFCVTFNTLYQKRQYIFQPGC